MGHRLSAIATRTGDNGTTGLGDGSRVSKCDARIAALGDVDELNSSIGVMIAFGLPTELDIPQLLNQIQQDLFDIGGELSIPNSSLLQSERVVALDRWLSNANKTLPRLREFILPGGATAAAQAHVCRAVCRRAERAIVKLSGEQAGTNTVRQYVNRLSDLLFVLARVLNRTTGHSEHQWIHVRGESAAKP